MKLYRLQHPNNSIGNRLKKFGAALNAAPPLISRANQLFFLCGANRAHNTPSRRREAIKKHLEGLSPEYRVIYAEGVFNELSKTEKNKNILDLEHEITNVADKIIIILESESAFCELGAFSHQKLRKKLIIINDKHHENSQSFINTGPISAAKEVNSPVLLYHMLHDKNDYVDSIGEVFNDLSIAATPPTHKHAVRVTSDLSDLSPRKEILYFIHDLIIASGPITRAELINILIVLFGKRPYDMITHLLGILREARLIYSFEDNNKRIYHSPITIPFLRYGPEYHSLTSAFRNHHLKNNPERLKNAKNNRNNF
ncbi:MAG: retron St85 family effector protein [Acidihalobacter sp.]|uniref:retron St85 family effector protein n=1 Tax=Acidihalobacter sp. TaxID=1872108 RepID=UPI00307FC24E